MNVLVGPNNSGKTTVLQSFRLLETMLRRSRSKSPVEIDGPTGVALGYYLTDDNLPIATENVHTDLADEETTVTFILSNGNQLQLYFPPDGGCALVPMAPHNVTSSSALFKAEFPVSIVTVPVLGQVEHKERLLQEKTVQRNVETHLAPRHFRNYWHYRAHDWDDAFWEFRTAVAQTWPGMDIREPELSPSGELSMYVLENRMTRELYWAGSGFQVWCQLLTHIGRAGPASILLVDEPDVYLHADLQRQLLSLLRNLDADVVLATHSTEIISEADPSEIVLVDKAQTAAQRLYDIGGVQNVLDEIGSVQNITLTRLAETKTILFVEGDKDYSIICWFARLLGYAELGSGVALADVASGGLSSWRRVRDLGWGLRHAFGGTMSIGAIYDRDYLPAEEIDALLDDLRAHISFAHFHARKEIENYLLIPTVLQRAVGAAELDRAKRAGSAPRKCASVAEMLDEITTPMKEPVKARYQGKRVDFLRHTKQDTSTIALDTAAWFESKWQSLGTRMEIVPGQRGACRSP